MTSSSSWQHSQMSLHSCIYCIFSRSLSLIFLPRHFFIILCSWFCWLSTVTVQNAVYRSVTLRFQSGCVFFSRPQESSLVSNTSLGSILPDTFIMCSYNKLETVKTGPRLTPQTVGSLNCEAWKLQTAACLSFAQQIQDKCVITALTRLYTRINN